MAPGPHPGHGARIRGDHEVDLVTRILQADVRSAALENQPARPERPAARGERAKVEADDDSTVGESGEGDAPPHVPHEQRQVEVVGVELGGGPPLPPLPEPLQDLAELFSRRSRPVFASPAAREGLALDDARGLQLAQPLTEQGPRDQRHALPDLVEAPRAGQQLPQDQRRPALGEGLARHRDRAELTIALHGGPTVGADPPARQVHFLVLAPPRGPAIVWASETGSSR